MSLFNAGYFRAHMYTCVPGHIREDLRRMKAAGTDAVTVSVLEQDVFAAVENLRIIHQTARDLGMRLYADISRWGGLVSGTPKVPSLWASLRPEVWKRHPDGRPVPSFGDLCPTASVFHPATFAFFRGYLERMLAVVPFDGYFWNEPKTLDIPDHSPMAVAWFQERGLDIQDRHAHARAHAEFFGRLNLEARKLVPALDIGCFLMPSTSGGGNWEQRVHARFEKYGPGDSHGIPYRCLCPRELRNVLVAGRCIGTDRAVNGSVRVMPVCLNTGEAAGVAAMMVGPETDIHRVDTEILRQRLKQRGAYLP